jgi:hypothetical protein
MSSQIPFAKDGAIILLLYQLPNKNDIFLKKIRGG